MEKDRMLGTSLIDQYVYSLPEYDMELQSSNFIEIYSDNGLHPTSKVIGK
jgi:hypothetical protein